MTTPSFKEDHLSQIPALQMLINLGYEYLSPETALQARQHQTNQVLLEEILRSQLRQINSIRVSSQADPVPFSDANLAEAIRRLREVPMVDGYLTTCQTVYDLLTQGIALEQTIQGNKKSYTLQYIDWVNPANNVYHVTEEYSVMRSGSNKHYRPDMVLFVNGIPLAVIECKRPDHKDPMQEAISQHLRNQQPDGIRPLYLYAQLVLSLATTEARYATNATPPEFWAHWEEKHPDDKATEAYQATLHRLRNTALTTPDKAALFGERAGSYFGYTRAYFDQLEQEDLLPTTQDAYLYSLCRPERLLDLSFNFIIFENSLKKVARYQQYFAIQKTMRRITHLQDGSRPGGVVWHTQGSGKSLTMVMLAQAIALHPDIPNPKIVLVTDRTDLDSQITKTFQKCDLPVMNATTGKALGELLQSKSDAVITTIINKFETAVKKLPKALTSPNIFVLVDEGHRTQHGTFNLDMQKTLPNACYIAFTGTPLFKKDKSTLQKFGGLIDSYTVDKAVQDGAVVPLLYEGRHAYQEVNQAPLDEHMNMVMEDLNEYERADLKKKFKRAEPIINAEPNIFAICWDIAKHYRQNFQGRTPFKGQVVCGSKAAAIKYKTVLDSIPNITCELVISPPDDREGETNAYESTDVVKQFWRRMMDEHGNAQKYQQSIVNRFTHDDHPELIIVVDKLLTGFDAPRNTVLYLTRSLRGHTLLQAIARVNRVYPDKDYGYVIDYYGVLGALDEALETYSAFEDFDADDLQGTLTSLDEEVRQLPQRHSELKDLFKTLGKTLDLAKYTSHLRDRALREEFYDKLAAYARILKLALSSMAFHQRTTEAERKQYKSDLAFFMKLRQAVARQYSDVVDYDEYKGQIQQLLDQHLRTEKIEPLTKLVNIFDKEAFQKEVARTVGETAKADMIASRTAKHISEKMEEDPALYQKFSEMLQEVIRDFEAQRISELQYLQKVKEVSEKVLNRTDSGIPEALQAKPVARAFYGIALEALQTALQTKPLAAEVEPSNLATHIALKTDEEVLKHQVVDWVKKVDIIRRIKHEVSDYIYDEIGQKNGLSLDFDNDIDPMVDKMIEVAKVRYA